MCHLIGKTIGIKIDCVLYLQGKYTPLHKFLLCKVYIISNSPGVKNNYINLYSRVPPYIIMFLFVGKNMGNDFHC